MSERPRNYDYTTELTEQFEQGGLAEMQAYPHFVVWKYTQVAGKIKKPPYNPKTGYVASPTNPDTWGSMQQALSALKTGKYNGIGFVFTHNDPFTGTDLDHCITEDGSIDHWAQDIVTALNSYTEYSPSKQGLHIITKATLPGTGRKIRNLEMYSQGRYFTLTTNHLSGTPEQIADRQQQQTALYRAYEPVSHKTREHRGMRLHVMTIPCYTKRLTRNRMPCLFAFSKVTCQALPAKAMLILLLS